jgi:hypothetical protein
MRVNLLGTYYDKRPGACVEGKHCIQAFPSVTVPITKEEWIPCNRYWAMYWFEDIENPLTVLCHCMTNSSMKWWQVNMEQIGTQVYSCPLPELQVLPSHVSFTVNKCDETNVYIPLYVSPDGKPGNEDVALCEKSLFGKWDTNGSLYLLSWLEALRVYGIKKLHMSYTSMELNPLLKGILNHYQNIGFLKFQAISNYLFEGYYPVDARESQSVVASVLNHCYGQLWHTYKYVISVDPDEIIVPRFHRSYTDFIRSERLKDPNVDNTTSISIRSAIFYQSFPDGSPDAVDYVPLLRKTLRVPVEIPKETWVGK